MVTTIINCLVAGILGALAIVIVSEIVDQFELTDPILAVIVPIIPVVIGVVVIVGMFMLLTRLQAG